MQDSLHNVLVKHTGQAVERTTDDIDRDYFLDAHAAAEYGIIGEALTMDKDGLAT